MQKIPFTECYKILNLKKESNLQEVRRSYKQQIQQYHPDRIQNDSADKLSAAEEKIKQLNAAYKILSDYYQKHGTLPPTINKERSTRAAINRKTVYQQSSRKQQTIYKPVYTKIKILVLGTMTGFFALVIYLTINAIDKEIEAENFNSLHTKKFHNKHKHSSTPLPNFVNKSNSNSRSKRDDDTTKFFTIGVILWQKHLQY